MKDHLLRLVEETEGDTNRRICVAREYLQARILQSFQESGVFMRWAFLGGTALRFLYSLPRFSEDLDFALIRAGEEARFEEAIEHAGRMFRGEGYDVSLAGKTRKTVAASFLRFEGLLRELGLSPDRRRIFSVKVELDTNPPPGAVFETTIVRRHVLLRLHHHDRSSLLAGKLHALLSRPWSKGRDLYDLAWYLADKNWPGPNLTLLGAALEQSGWREGEFPLESWKCVLRERLGGLDWDAVRTDALPFLERLQEEDLIRPEHILPLLA